MYTKARGDNTFCVRAMCFMFHQQLWSYEKVPQPKISADRLVKLGINATATGFHGEGLIHHIIASPDLILYVPTTIFQFNRDGSSWVEPVLKLG